MKSIFNLRFTCLECKNFSACISCEECYASKICGRANGMPCIKQGCENYLPDLDTGYCSHYVPVVED